MDFKEYKNAAYWQNIRKMGDERIAVEPKDIAVLVLGFAGLIVSLFITLSVGL